jgi:chromosome segregation ATPase
MTLLGKVLVFVNLAFSLAVAFFITQSYARRTDWHRAYDDANKALVQAGNQRDQYAQQAQDAVAQGKANVATVQANLDKTLQEKGQCDAQVKDLQAQIQKHKDTLAKAGMGSELTLAEIKRLGERAQKVEKLLADANKRLDDQTKVVEDFRQRAVKAEIDNKSLIARNNELANVIQ